MKEYIKHGEGTFTSLTKEQKKAVKLLSIGTFLEYFDLMLYVHMGVLLNELFFPKTDPHIAALLSAFAFCSTYLLRPFGALIFGWIGDTIGRKVTVIITTFLMAGSCLVMAVLPTYSEKGLIATILVIICRIIQGLSSMGELVGAQLYLLEMTKPPVQYPVVLITSVSGNLGGMIALAVATLVTSFGLNWRIAFWIGTMVAIIGATARTALRETPEFADAKRRIKKNISLIQGNANALQHNLIYNEKVNWKTTMFLLLISCGWPICFYFTYIYCGNILKTSFGFTAEQVIHQNFIVSIVNFCVYLLLTYLSYIIYPLKILRVKLIVFCIFTIICPYLLNSVTTSSHIFLIQAFVMLFFLSANPAMPIFLKYFPIFKRFRSASIVFALSTTIMNIAISFGLVYLTERFGHFGLQIMLTPIIIGFSFGLCYFWRLEKNS
ncbi:MAG: MFS transporter [Rickettsia endosymbiont of Pseudomimeciton antennatum]|nr:MFS transporter [Rickettsia endosymbiont of Pseudomimeciton antennatum]